jgi:hypothetical protein
MWVETHTKRKIASIKGSLSFTPRWPESQVYEELLAKLGAIPNRLMSS